MTDQKILIVDDDQDLLRGLSIRLRAYGYKVLSAADAISAISVARKEEPDLVILDIGLPGGDGFTVMQRMSSLGGLATIPVIILTGRDASENRERAFDAGARAFLQKPVDNDLLLAAISQALGKNADTREEPAPRSEAPITTKKILIVDDDQDLLRGLSIRLRASGYKVLSAADAISAISVARKEEPDLVILDIGLPGGDGFTVMQRMSSLGGLATIPVIILTGRDVFANEEKAINAGARAFLQKPVDNDVLLAEIKQALGENTETQEKTHSFAVESTV